MIFNASTLAAFAVTSTAVVVATPTARDDLFEKGLPSSTDGIADMTTEIQASHDEIIPAIDLDATRNYHSSDAQNLLLGEDHTLTNAHFVEEKFVGDETVTVVTPDSGILHESSHSYDTGMNNDFSSLGDKVQVIERNRGLSAGCSEYAELEDNYSDNYDLYYLIDGCLYGDGCPSDVRDLSCWKTSKVTDMSHAFQYKFNFNEDISQWDTSSVTKMEYMFEDADEFNGDLSTWDTSEVKLFGSMFRGNSKFNGDIDGWNTSSATDMRSMFRYSVFNGDLSTWDTSKVEDFAFMFQNMTRFNGDIEKWDTSSATQISGMFRYSVFNGDLSTWDTSKVEDFSYMFRLTKFNGNIGGWDTSSATQMNSMFRSAAEFNGDLSTWDTSKVSYFSYMFRDATKFNGGIDRWNTSAALYMQGMFHDATNFDQCLSTWAIKTNDVLNTNDMFTGSGCPVQTSPDPKVGPWCQDTASCTLKAKNCRNCLKIAKQCVIQCVKAQKLKKFRVVAPKCNKKCCKELCKISDSLEACTKKEYCE